MAVAVGRRVMADTGPIAATFKVAKRPVRSDKEVKNTELAQVPIDVIFKVEFQALQIPLSEQKEIRDRYEGYVAALASSVKGWLDANNISDIKKADERKLFTFLSEALYREIKPTYREESMLSTSITKTAIPSHSNSVAEEKIVSIGPYFNCYSSSVLLADVLARSGKPTKVVTASGYQLLYGEKYSFGHVLLVGETCAFETALKPENAAISLSEFDSNYPHRQELGFEGLLGSAYDWAGVTHANNRRFGAARACFNKETTLNPNCAPAHYNKGEALRLAKRYDGALAAFDEAIRLNPQYASPWEGKAFVFFQTGNFDKAKEYVKKVKEIEEAITPLLRP